MFSFFKKNKDLPTVPNWASFFTPEQYSAFIQGIDRYFKKRNLTYTLGDGMLSVSENDFGFGNLGLNNVAQVCRQNNSGNYDSIIETHFETLVRSKQFETGFNKMVGNFEEVKKYIGVRLYATDYIRQVGEQLTITKPFAGDILCMLVFDLPDSIINVKPAQAAIWNKSMDELFDLGMENILNNYPCRISQENFIDFKIWLVQGDHFFAPNIVLDLENHRNLIGSRGALIGIPHRHTAIIYPIENMEVVNAVNKLIPLVNGMFSEGPGSISNNLFWYHDGDFENLPYSVDGNTLKFSPPANFIELLNSLNA